MSAATHSRNVTAAISLLCFLSLLSGIKSDELQILLNLKSSFRNSKTQLFDSWDSKTPLCNFPGIICNSNGSVSGIELSKQKLSGILPLDSICQLNSLERLSLGFNSLYGTVTEDLRNCTKLKYLDLGNNIFSGPVPDLSPLTDLQYLYLNTSGFSGSFPWKSLAEMKGLVQLSLGDNPFEPTTEFPSELLSLTNLNLLYLSNCSLGGKIPAGIGNLVELENLELSDNNIAGEIPAEIGKLTKLWQLELYHNNLSGKLPVGLRNLTKLENFDASRNNLEGDLSELKFLTNLVSLQLFENSFSGEVPAELGGFKRLVNLSLYTNKLTGPLPQKLGSWAEFGFIDVSENFLTGPIPPDMCKRGTMNMLLMLQNNFTGKIPESYASCKTLLRFRVSKNSLSGEVPAGIWGLPAVNIIDLEFNQFEGPITSDIKNAKGLAQLFVGTNRLTGGLPEEISEATSLVSIQLNGNRFSGEIPASIGELKHLGALHLQSNMLSGSIPDSLGSCSSLNDVNISNNSLSGKIPSSLGSLPSLNALDLSHNQLSGQIPASLASVRLSLLDLSHNRLSGPVPPSLSIAAYNGSFAGNPGLCSPEITSFRRCPPNSGMSKDVRTLIICFSVGSAILLVALAWFTYLRKGEKDDDQERSLKEESWDLKSFHVLTFTEEEILDSIKQENLIGNGGSGHVYRVLLSNGKELAVKHIWNNVDSKLGRRKARSTTPMLAKRGGGKSKEFDAEVQTLSSIRHVNVVKLYCSITSEDSSLLVYEYLPNGSLWDRLHGCRKTKLDWNSRHEIAVGAAKGLEYLHHGCSRPVIHRDVKSSNILLDEFLKPRISDFGLAKGMVQANNGGQSSTHVIAGTHGYIAPEYGYTYKVNEKSDVYSFGVVLMELVTGKRPIEPEFGENRDIVSWVYNNLKNRESVLSLVDSDIPEVLKEEAIKVLKIAVLCTARLPELRPTMRSVVQMLEEAEPCKLVGIIVTKDGASKRMDGLDDTKFDPDFQSFGKIDFANRKNT
ncbi:Serine/threonine protein kinase [Trema orientale]|uniref:non-specific serine/threonine protein kinase n=1 Tax=Trema orientale TaxID=63057 RepID=A0A2P5C637_TREOI|nr:Serine/threonine protein kinase [Trema orientale]